MAEVIKVQSKLSIFFGPDDLAKLFYEARFSIRRKPHDFAFVAVVRKAQELSRRGVDDSG